MRFTLVAAACALAASVCAQDINSLEAAAQSIASDILANTGNAAAESTALAIANSFVNSVGSEFGINFSSFLPGGFGSMPADATSAINSIASDASAAAPTGASATSQSPNAAPAPTAMGLSAAAAAGIVGAVALL